MANLRPALARQGAGPLASKSPYDELEALVWLSLAWLASAAAYLAKMARVPEMMGWISRYGKSEARPGQAWRRPPGLQNTIRQPLAVSFAIVGLAG